MSDDRDKILLADDEPEGIFGLETLLGEAYQIHTAATGERAWEILQEEDIAVALVDLTLEDLDGLQLLQRMQKKLLGTELIVVTGHASIDTAVDAMRLGAYDYLAKPIEGKRLLPIVAKAAEKYRLWRANRAMTVQLRELTRYEELLGQSETMRELYRLIETVAKTDATVLITGESGSGKELVARAIHRRSERNAAKFVAMNCSALPAEILENELFGHEKGAFTGAIARKIGRFELADGGTIFLDEIGELPPELQAKLLRVLQEGEFERVGGQQTLRVNTRVIAATNRDLKAEIAHGRFREDLYYRLHVFPITIPPLRERRDDIPLLISHFVKKYSARTGKKVETVSQNLIATLQAYDWPGNVRELENVIERAVIVSRGKQLKLDEWLPNDSAGSERKPPLFSLEEMERHHILKVLEQTNWRISGERGAARILNINASTLRSRMEKLGIKK